VLAHATLSTNGLLVKVMSMKADERLPNHYFRIGVSEVIVHRIVTDERLNRLNMVRIATINMNLQFWNVDGGMVLDDADEAAINDWITKRRGMAGIIDEHNVRQIIEKMNSTADWFENMAGKEEVLSTSQPLLLAIYDLRSVIVKRKADALSS